MHILTAASKIQGVTEENWHLSCYEKPGNADVQITNCIQKDKGRGRHKISKYIEKGFLYSKCLNSILATIPHSSFPSCYLNSGI